MESTGHLHRLPPRETLREGQRQVIDRLSEPELPTDRRLVVKLPTGYGKTYTAALAYSVLEQRGVVNRVLYVVPTRAQLNQFCRDGSSDFQKACVSNPLKIIDIGDKSVSAVRFLREHRSGKCKIFACTIQALAHPESSILDAIKEAMQVGRWMVVIDEYHHYGIERAWGDTLDRLNYVFLIAMSATPSNRAGLSLGRPSIDIAYHQAATKEHAVKRLRCHSYVYLIDALVGEGEIRTYTTDQFFEDLGTDDPERIDKLMLKRKMRWSPKYISPLVDVPLVRLERTRLDTGGIGQMLVSAMSVAHAKHICEQMQSMYKGWRIDWVGTGEFGRSDEENRQIVERFCPRKIDGERRWDDVQLDVLVHVGIAGEGLDSIFVTENVFLNGPGKSVKAEQIIGRASRPIPGLTADKQLAHISVDSSSAYSQCTGDRIMAAMDDLSPEEAEQLGLFDEPESNADDIPPLPDEPEIRIWDMRLDRIDEGVIDKMVDAMREAARRQGSAPVTIEQMFADGEKARSYAWDIYRTQTQREADAHNEKAIHAQWREAVNSAVNQIVRHVIRIGTAGNLRIDRTMRGDIKSRVQHMRARLFGRYENSSVEELQKQYTWAVEIERQMLETREIPQWLR